MAKRRLAPKLSPAAASEVVSDTSTQRARDALAGKVPVAETLATLRAQSRADPFEGHPLDAGPAAGLEAAQKGRSAAQNAPQNGSAKPSEDREPSRMVGFRLAPSDHAAVVAAAGDRSVAEWVRDVVLLNVHRHSIKGVTFYASALDQALEVMRFNPAIEPSRVLDAVRALGVAVPQTWDAETFVSDLRKERLVTGGETRVGEKRTPFALTSYGRLRLYHGVRR